MSKHQLVITAVLAGQSQSAVARRYGVSQGWISKLMARYRLEGEAAFEPRSRRPKTTPSATPPQVVALVLELRRRLSAAGLDAGADTIAWHLEHTHRVRVHRATVHRILTRHDMIDPEPSKRPKSSYVRFEAAMPNECWQSDFTHYRLTRPDQRPGADTEIITWLDDHSRYALHVSAHRVVTAKIVHNTFTQAASLHGYPASTLTDNGMVYTVRLAAAKNKGGHTALEAELATRGIIQKNGKPNHPTTQGKVERFQQTMKKWLAAQPNQPTTLAELNTMLQAFVDEYNHHRPHRSLPHRATPATTYTSATKATPSTEPPSTTHDRGLSEKRWVGLARHAGIAR